MPNCPIVRIALLTVGSRGDVEPVVAVARGLAAAGHEPTVATHEPFRQFVEGRGLRFAPITGDPQALMTSPKVQTLLASGRNPLKMLRGFASVLDDIWPDYVATTTAACAGQDALVYTPLAFSAWHLGQAMSVPTGMLALQPFGTTRNHLPPAVLAGRSMGAWLNRLGHLAQQQVAWMLARRHIEPWRMSSLALPPLGRLGQVGVIERSGEPIIHAYSASVFPPASDWPDRYLVTGWCYLDRRPGWTPPDDLVEFLADGPPPVYAGFGSMVDARVPELTRAVVDALLASGRRGVLATGWGGLQPGLVDERLFVIEDVPHSWLLPQVAAAVHHGGAGTTGAVFRAGVPHVVAPVFGDQHFWARVVEQNDVGTEVDRTQLSSLGDAIESVDRESTRARAQRLATRIASEHGVATTVAAIDRLILSRA